MFNRSAAFNRMPYSRPFSIEILLSATLDGSGTMTAALTMDLTMSAQLDGHGELVADLIRELFLSATLNGVGTMDVAMIRERMMAAALNGEGSLQGNLSRYHVDMIEIVGDVAPGDRLVIDAAKLTVTKNGANALHMLQGDFFDLNTGTNDLLYTDDEAGRSVLIRVTNRDKYV